MEINADFSQRVAVHAASLQWVSSPIAGVERRMLDRIGDEIARATSLVRYAAGSRFSPHTHGGGEEILVLDGVFQDECGDYPAGTYVRNPPISRHTPRSAGGCILLVKLWQFNPADRREIKASTAGAAYAQAKGRPGVELLPLFHDREEDVRLEWWSGNADIELDVPDGAELLVLEGAFEEADERFEPLSWLRMPTDSILRAKAGPYGCRLWIKTGHLREVRGAHVAPGIQLGE